MFFCSPPPPTEIYTLSLHDALPICAAAPAGSDHLAIRCLKAIGIHALAISAYCCIFGLISLLTRWVLVEDAAVGAEDRKSTRLNSSHRCISYAVFCLKKKKNEE